jgi:hypothetical protein
MLTGNLGKAVIKVSAVKPERHVVEAPARVFHSQEAAAGRLQGKGEPDRRISSPWCASRDRRPTACRNCTS